MVFRVFPDHFLLTPSKRGVDPLRLFGLSFQRESPLIILFLHDVGTPPFLAVLWQNAARRDGLRRGYVGLRLWNLSVIQSRAI